MFRIVIVTLFFTSMLFSQTFVNNINFTPYIEDFYVGLQVNPVLTGLKGNVSNQEIDLNLVLLYHNKYTLTNNQVLGFLEGRLISETPLSSFDMLERIRKDTSLILSNYAENYKTYQDALDDFRSFQNNIDSNIIGDDSVYYNEDEEFINDGEYIDNSIEENYYPNQEEIPVYYNEDEEFIDDGEYTDDGIEENYYPNQEGEYINNGIEEIYIEADATVYNDRIQALISLPQKILAQSINPYIEAKKQDLALPLPYTNRDTQHQTLSSTELEFLIKIEQLKKAYDEMLENYNTIMAEEQKKYKDDFDPADPTERFTVILIGERNSPLWIKNFGLDGSKNYQSYNSQVWYLGYQIPLTKKDIRALYNVFHKNKQIKYLIKGSQSIAMFDLSPYFINAVKELTDVYVRGGFIIDDSTDFPMMRNRNEDY